MRLSSLTPLPLTRLHTKRVATAKRLEQVELRKRPSPSPQATLPTDGVANALGLTPKDRASTLVSAPLEAA